MKYEDRKKLIELINQIKEIVPEFDTSMVTEDSIIITSLDNVEAMAESMGYEVEVYTEDDHELLDYLGMDDDDEDGNGGLLQ